MPTPGDETRTSPTLLRRGADWRDDRAWAELVGRYESLLRLCCRDVGLEAGAAEEVIQRVWIDLARHLPTFRYDPDGSFRGWLRSLCRSRALDLIRERGRRVEVPLDEAPGALDDWVIGLGRRDDEGDPSAEELARLRDAAEIRWLVRSKVAPETWRAFELVVIEGRSLEETARLLGKTRAATFAAQKRVRERLRSEGDRLLAERAARMPDGVGGPPGAVA
jgi:RNA polymerase sigma-70 factor (ECF subfamily)